MADKSQNVNLTDNETAVDELRDDDILAQVDSKQKEPEGTAASGAVPSTSTGGKKKKPKKKHPKTMLNAGSSSASLESSKVVGGLRNDQLQELLSVNPALSQQLDTREGTELSPAKVQDALKKLKLEDVMMGLASSGKNVKDMASYKFWGTQPVPKFGESERIIEEGPFKIIDPAQVPKDPGPLVEGFEWVTMDLTNDCEIEEVFTLLYAHYVEDDEAMFRFNYSKSFLKWALMSPGWTKDWHVGVRATTSRKLVAFISAIPVALRVRKMVLHASEVNFLCIHKKLRSKRLTPVLIKEITRRCYRVGTWQAIYTAGVVLPKPISTCQYYHRSIDWQKLWEVGFSHLPANSKPSYQVRKYALPEQTATKNLRPMEAKDIDAVLSLLKRYLEKFDIAPVFTAEEIEHWLLHKKDAAGDQVIWSYVVEDPATNLLTDFFSFYALESSVINNEKHKNIRAAYMFYYASEHGLSPAVTRDEFSSHLNRLVNDALIIANKYKFDVFNALTLMDNNLFLEQQKFGAGDGQLHYYLYNYNAKPIAGGVDRRSAIAGLSGVGVVML